MLTRTRTFIIYASAKNGAGKAKAGEPEWAWDGRYRWDAPSTGDSTSVCRQDSSTPATTPTSGYAHRPRLRQGAVLLQMVRRRQGFQKTQAYLQLDGAYPTGDKPQLRPALSPQPQEGRKLPQQGKNKEGV